MEKQRIVMYGLMVDTAEHKKQLVEGFEGLGFGTPVLVGQFKTLPGQGGEGGRNDVIIDVDMKAVNKMAVHPMHLSGGFSWVDDYYANHRELIPTEALKYFAGEVKEDFGISLEKFEAYEEVRSGGQTNMFDVKNVIALSDGVLTKADCLAIMKNYDALCKLYPGVRE